MCATIALQQYSRDAFEKRSLTKPLGWALCLGLLVGETLTTFTQPAAAGPQIQENDKRAGASIATLPAENKLSFKMDSISNSLGDGGRWATTYTFVASDGEKVYKSLMTFESRAAAAKALQENIRVASKIVERGPLKNKKGKTIGERVVLLWPESDPARRSTGIIRTDGLHLCQISSKSLQNALALERLINTE